MTDEENVNVLAVVFLIFIVSILVAIIVSAIIGIEYLKKGCVGYSCYCKECGYNKATDAHQNSNTLKLECDKTNRIQVWFYQDCWINKWDEEECSLRVKPHVMCEK